VVFCGVTSAAGPPVDADAPLASDSDNPAAPKTGTVLLRRFRFEACLVRAISGSPILSTKQQAHRVLRPVGHSLTTRTTVVVLWVSWPACTFRAALHAAADERCAAPHAAADERCAAPHVACGDRRAALDAVSYRALIDPVAYRALVERSVLERLVMAAPEPQHLTPLAWWSAAQIPTRRPVREGKMRLDARLVVHSYWRPPRNLPRNDDERLLKMNAR
jgi:hypothetical protein